MTRYIDAELRIKDIQEEYCKPCKKHGGDYRGVKCRACWVGDCISIIDDTPEVDVQPVVHAKWIYDKDGMDWNLGAWKCSKCKQRNINIAGLEDINPLAFVGSNYCPHCGARMDGDEHE